jgi:hypothetical protein
MLYLEKSDKVCVFMPLEIDIRDLYIVHFVTRMRPIRIAVPREIGESLTKSEWQHKKQ